ncbi:rhomboid family intramembrane serine protease [Arthrobacter sp. zg.Y919]|nr:MULTISPECIES: rhomboid family intramembrane serine protease [unclassified Arthrobacter]MCC9144254.1 rhomboid family intramembrane serine protease [Arthrobacter sp. zg-Y919]MDK1275479.1 rhomboid family intramembrane serine protease [Arthrobacter sp. zg.Y919]WIB03144.1 rhomboid family intramembrane serine protease [Arthrobacter sp. zg-Y919]
MSYGVPAEGPASQVPVCPRHPDRVSYIRCQRCGRPACPECQTNAAVGVQCVDCFNEQRKAQPAYRTPFGGRVARTEKPVVTITIMAICVVAFLLQQLLPEFTRTFFFAPVLADYQPWRLLTAAFLHSQGGVIHIAFNLYALWFLGRSLEPLFGRARFALLYLISALGGSVGVMYLAEPATAVVGASGAVFGLFGALFVVIRQRRGELRSLLILLAVNLVLGFVFPGIAWQAHVGGLITGAACAAILAYTPRGKHRTAIQLAGLAGVVLLLIVAAVLWQSPVQIIPG